MYHSPWQVVFGDNSRILSTHKHTFFCVELFQNYQQNTLLTSTLQLETISNKSTNCHCFHGDIMKILIWILYSYIFSAKHFRWTYTFSSAFIIQWTLWLLCSAHMLFIEYHSVNAMAFMFRPHAVGWTSFSEHYVFLFFFCFFLCSAHMLFAEHHSVNAVA